MLFDVQKMMRELLIRDDVNVVIVSWIGGAGPPYTQAVANTRLVGAMLGRLASQIIQTAHVQPSRVHCIGHSLGAHTCGYLGYNLRVQYGHKLGRITGESSLELRCLLEGCSNAYSDFCTLEYDVSTLQSEWSDDP